MGSLFAKQSRHLSYQFSALYQNRDCDQEDISIAVIGGENDSKNVLCDKPFLLNNFDTKILSA